MENMIPRTLTGRIQHFLERYPIVTVTGPRQSGKLTLLRHLYKEYEIVSLEDPDVLTRVREDPRLFLRQHPELTIIDEAQRFPELFSFMQSHIDWSGKDGMYILTGSHNILLIEGISQSLAGRTAILRLLPLSIQEIRSWREARNDAPLEYESHIIKGGYPRVHDKNLEPEDYYPFYIKTFVERDIRLIRNVSDLHLFHRFLKLCAGRIGQLVNASSLANDCGITQPTARQWLSLLEESYIVHLLRPYHRHYNKQVVKTPKLYFHDTGLACSLLGIKRAESVLTHYLGGALFENMVVSEALKSAWNRGEEEAMWFWRDHSGNEVDLIMESDGDVSAIEIRSGATYLPEMFRGVEFWQRVTGTPKSACRVIYGGSVSMETARGTLQSWRDMAF